jgi:pimeloyl-ACP methyl ester carboxylesterase
LNYIEYGKQNSDVIILLHGGGLSWWNYKEVAEMLQTDYHVVLPILDGHAESDRDFTTMEDNAMEIIEFIEKQFGGSVLMIGGLSLGGQVLLEILSQRKDICRYAFIESTLVIPSKFTYSLIKPTFGSCYGFIRYKWFSKLQFQSLRIKPDLFDEYYKDTCGISKNDMISFLEANSVYALKESIEDCEAKIHIFVGEKENRKMKKSAAMIHEKLEGSFLNILPDMYHGEFSINHAGEYVEKLLDIAVHGWKRQ